MPNQQQQQQQQQQQLPFSRYTLEVDCVRGGKGVMYINHPCDKIDQLSRLTSLYMVLLAPIDVKNIRLDSGR